MDLVRSGGPGKGPAAAHEDVFSEEEIFCSNGSIDLAGTLTVPRRSPEHAAVILISDSGPIDRDGRALAPWTPYKTLAHDLARRGIATLRYDSRGAGGSAGDSLQGTTSDFASDVLALLRPLQVRDDINPQKIGLLGHGEGGLVAALAASRSEDVAFIVCLSAPGLRGDETLLESSELTARVHGASDMEIRKTREIGCRLHDCARGCVRGSGFRHEVAKLARTQVELEARYRNGMARNVDSLSNARADGLWGFYTSPWLRSFIDHDPAQALSSMSCPPLLVFGELDLQVPPAIHLPATILALNSGKARAHTVYVFRAVNHLYQPAVTGSPLEHGDLPAGFAPGFSDYVADWMRWRVNSAVRDILPVTC